MPRKVGREFVLALLCSAALSGCVTTQEVPLAPNMVRLDTHAAGALFVGQASGQTLKRAAELTLQNGYTHFRLESVQTGQGEQLAGVYSSRSATAFATGYGATGFSSGFSTPLCAHGGRGSDCRHVPRQRSAGEGRLRRRSDPEEVRELAGRSYQTPSHGREGAAIELRVDETRQTVVCRDGRAWMV
jgi:hypothetical protein